MGVLDLGEPDMYEPTLDTSLNTNLIPDADIAPFLPISIPGSQPNPSQTYTMIQTDFNTYWSVPSPGEGLVAASKADMY